MSTAAAAGGWYESQLSDVFFSSSGLKSASERIKLCYQDLILSWKLKATACLNGSLTLINPMEERVVIRWINAVFNHCGNDWGCYGNASTERRRIFGKSFLPSDGLKSRVTKKSKNKIYAQQKKFRSMTQLSYAHVCSLAFALNRRECKTAMLAMSVWIEKQFVQLVAAFEVAATILWMRIEVVLVWFMFMSWESLKFNAPRRPST